MQVKKSRDGTTEFQLYLVFLNIALTISDQSGEVDSRVNQARSSKPIHNHTKNQMTANILAVLERSLSCRRLIVSSIALIVITLMGGSPLLATTYYVSTSGNDSYTAGQAVNIATPWRTIQRAASSMAAGDTCLIRAGTYEETVTPSSSGSSSALVTFQAYGTESVTISGLTSLTGWTLESTNIYYAPMTWTLGEGNQVFQSGSMKPEARWPNAGSAFPWQNSSVKPSSDWSYFTTTGYNGSANGWFTDSSLPSRANNYWVGATVHAMSGSGWVMFYPKVIASTGTVVTTNDPFGGQTSYQFTAGNEYYLSGVKGEMDSAGEWYYDAANSRLYIYSTSTPTNVQAKQRAYGFNLSGRSYIQLVNLHFLACSIQTDVNSLNETYNGLTMLYLNHCNTYSTEYGLTMRSGTVLRNSELGYDSQGLLNIAGNDVRVINNQLHDSGYIPNWTAMVQNSGNTYRALISHNTMHDAGRAILGFLGSASIIEYNNLSNAMRLTSDGGILYCEQEAGNSIIRYNLFHDSRGPAGHNGAGVQGLYLDCQNSNWVIHHNIIWNVPGFSMQINARDNFNMIFNNTCTNFGAAGIAAYFPDTDGETGTKVYNNLVGSQLCGETAAWAQTDLRNNLYTDPGFISGTFQVQSTNSQVVNQGVVIAGVTDGYVGAAPDLGALENGGTDWTSSAGYSTTPPSPDPVYSFPSMLFVNMVKDGSFETGSLTPNWTALAGSNVSLHSGNAWAGVEASQLRSGYYGLQFGQGTSEVRQVVTGLQPGRRYKLYAGTHTTDATALVKVGVRNYGYSAAEVIAPATASDSYVMNNLTFFTGASTTSAEIYINVVSSTSTPVYADDFSVERHHPVSPASVVDPILQYGFNQSSGLTVVDSSLFNKTGTVCGTTAPTWQTGVQSNALTFDGSSVYVQAPAVSVSAGITVSCWAKSSTATWNADGCLISDRGIFILHPWAGTRNLTFYVYTSAGSKNVSWNAPSGFDLTQWHHYAGVYSPSTGALSIYVDGVSSGPATVTGTIGTSSSIVSIGQDLGRYFSGLMDDVRIYNQALTASQIKEIATLNSGLVLRHAYDESSGTTKSWDASGYGKNGTLTNMNVSTAWGSGIVSGALSFDGTSSYVIVPAVSSTQEFTASCWAKSNTSTWNAYGCLVSDRGFFILHPTQGSKNILFYVYTTQGAQCIEWSAPTEFDITQWHYYAGVCSTTTHTMSFYVDGAPVRTATFTGSVSTSANSVYIGADSMAGRNFSGQMDEVRIYNRALSQSELLELSDQTSGPLY